MEETNFHEHVFSKEDKSRVYGVSEPSGLRQTKSGRKENKDERQV